MENDSFSYAIPINGYTAQIPSIDGVALFSTEFINLLYNLLGQGNVRIDKVRELNQYVFSLRYYPVVINRVISTPGAGRVVHNVKNFASSRQVAFDQYLNTWYPEGIDIDIFNSMKAEFEQFVFEMESEINGLINNHSNNTYRSSSYFNNTTVASTANTATAATFMVNSGQVSSSTAVLKYISELENELLKDDYADSGRYVSPWGDFPSIAGERFKKDYFTLTSLKTSNTFYPYNQSDLSLRRNGVDDSYDVYKLDTVQPVTSKSKDTPPPPPQLELF